MRAAWRETLKNQACFLTCLWFLNLSEFIYPNYSPQSQKLRTSLWRANIHVHIHIYMIPGTKVAKKMLHNARECKRWLPLWRDVQMMGNGSKSCGINVSQYPWLKRLKTRKRGWLGAGVPLCCWWPLSEAGTHLHYLCSPLAGYPGWQPDKAPVELWWAAQTISSYSPQSTVQKEVALMPFASWLLFPNVPTNFWGT